ncbi:MAG: TolC family protein, partial [Deltaproteobacteria bacterium]|nr:TolC family protein [Nannocystaceae bacterium]
MRRELSFSDALTVALAHNGELYLAQGDVAIAGDELALAGSVFAPRLVGNARVAREDQPGNAQSFAWKDQLASASLGITGLLPTGLTYALDLGASAERLSSPFLTVFSPAYTTGLTLSLTQPLLRGGWRSINRQPIYVAALRRDVTVQQLQVRLAELVGEVEVAYWSLVLAYREREAREASLKLAQDQLAESTRLVRLGTISDLDVLEARAGVGRTQQQLIRAQQQVADAEGGLRIVIVGNPDWGPDDSLVAIDNPDLTPVSYSVEEHLQLAHRNRPDLVAAHVELEAESAALAVTEDGLLPALDLVATASKLGFAGDLERNYVTSGVSVFDNSLSPSYVVNPDLNGGLGDSFKNLTTSGNYTVSLGLKLDLPLDNSAARARHDRQRHVRARAQTAKQ